MKIAEVVNRAAAVIPQLTDLFSTSLAIASLSGNGSLITVVTVAEHGLSTGMPVNMKGVQTENTITAASLPALSEIASFTTENVNDLTLGWPPHEYIELTGFIETQWNGSHLLEDVTNRKNFKANVGTLPTPTINGDQKLLEIVSGVINGPQEVTVVDSFTFTFPSSFNGVGSITNASVETNIRITGMVNIERVRAQYTVQPLDNWWMFITQLDSAITNKSRRTDTDLNSESSIQTDFEEYIADGFNVFCLGPSSQSSSGLVPSDTARDEILPFLLSSFRGYTFSSGLSCPPNQVTNLLNHGPDSYNEAVYSHLYQFQAPILMTVDDSIPPVTRAFRDIDFTNIVEKDDDSQELTVSINLDKDPL